MMSEREHDAMIEYIGMYARRDLRSRAVAVAAWEACSEWHRQQTAAAESQALREVAKMPMRVVDSPLADAMWRSGEECQ